MTIISEGENRAVTKEVEKVDRDADYIGTVGKEHIYLGGMADIEFGHFLVHNQQTGQTHNVEIEHEGELPSERDIQKAAGRGVSPKAVKVIYKELKDELDEEKEPTIQELYAQHISKRKLV